MPYYHNLFHLFIQQNMFKAMESLLLNGYIFLCPFCPNSTNINKCVFYLLIWISAILNHEYLNPFRTYL